LTGGRFRTPLVEPALRACRARLGNRFAWLRAYERPFGKVADHGFGVIS
jgi:hypothetical protein